MEMKSNRWDSPVLAEILEMSPLILDQIKFLLLSRAAKFTAAATIDEIKRTERKWEVNVVDEYVVNTFHEKRRQTDGETERERQVHRNKGLV